MTPVEVIALAVGIGFISWYIINYEPDWHSMKKAEDYTCPKCDNVLYVEDNIVKVHRCKSCGFEGIHKAETMKMAWPRVAIHKRIEYARKGKYRKALGMWKSGSSEWKAEQKTLEDYIK